MMLLKISWRNLWRNRRRSLIVLTSIVVGVTAIVFIESYARGFMRQLFDNQLGSSLGHIQIHAAGFNENKVVQNFMQSPDTVMTVVQASPLVRFMSRRVIAFGLVSSASNSSGASIIGINPTEEANITTIKVSVVEGRYLGEGGHEIVIGKRLAQTLNVGLGDRLVTMASTQDGRVGSEMFRVVGLYQSASLSFDNMNIFVPLATLQSMLRVQHQIAEVVIVCRDVNLSEVVKADLKSTLGDGFEVLSYRDLIPSLISQVELMDKMMSIFYLLIGIAMMFGIINTLLMSVFERIHEFGVLKAIGMKNIILFRMIVLEAFLLGSIGAGIGALLGIGISSVLAKYGINFSAFSEGLASYGAGAIIYPLINYLSVLVGVLVIIIVSILAAVYPAYKAMRMEPMTAIRYV
ncbi:MAG: FtsX-like permease family protein [bacterium]